MAKIKVTLVRSTIGALPKHKKTVEELTNVEDVVNYDYTVGYPTKLNFNI